MTPCSWRGSNGSKQLCTRNNDSKHSTKSWSRSEGVEAFYVLQTSSIYSTTTFVGSSSSSSNSSRYWVNIQ